MAYKLKDRIFGYFGNYDKQTDTYKDVNKKGINQRYHESLGEDFDVYVLPFLDKLLDNTINPRTTQDKFVAYLEAMIGNIVIVKNTAQHRKKIIELSNRIYEIKGTLKSYRVMLMMLGFTGVVIEEIYKTYGFDSAVTLDDPERFFDMGCLPCSEYNLRLSGGVVINDELRKTIYRIDEFLAPINAIRKDIFINGTSILYQLIDIFIDANGDLIYNNANDPSLVLELRGGDLIVSGPNASKYFINAKGDLIFIVS